MMTVTNHPGHLTTSWLTPTRSTSRVSPSTSREREIVEEIPRGTFAEHVEGMSPDPFENLVLVPGISGFPL
jgi:hypothetical protein